MEQHITIVSGLPRSGTSMMMRALEAGGMPVLVDRLRAPDADNPRGYYELEAVKRTSRDPGWLASAPGQAVKVISYLLGELPQGYRYKVLFMRRQLDEVLLSQRAMLARRGERDDGDEAETRRALVGHLAAVERLLRRRRDMEVLFVSYNRVLAEPRRQVARIDTFLGGGLDLGEMAASVDPSLYRQRAHDEAGHLVAEGH